MLFLHDPITEYSQPARDKPVEKNRPRRVQRTSYKHRVITWLSPDAHQTRLNVEISCTHSQINIYEGKWIKMRAYEGEWIYTSYNFVNHILELLVGIYIRSFPHEKWPHAPDSREQWKSHPVRSSVDLTSQCPYDHAWVANRLYLPHRQATPVCLRLVCLLTPQADFNKYNSCFHIRHVLCINRLIPRSDPQLSPHAAKYLLADW